MKIRDAGALALVGWYLMLLPKSDDHLHRFDTPWSATQRSFDTAKECEDARARAIVPPIQNGPATGYHEGLEHAYCCIASDDPRLKSN